MIQKAATVVDIEVGRRIRDTRELRKVSQSTLAEALGITFQQIQKYESGKNRISFARLIALAAHLGVPPTHFLPVSAWPADADPLSEILSSKDGRELAAIFLAQNDAHRSALVEIARAATALRS